MRETSPAMKFLLEVLNANFASSARQELKKIERLRERGSHYKDREMAAAQSALKRKIAFITDSDEANDSLKKSSPTKTLVQNTLNVLASTQSQVGAKPESAKLLALVEDLNDWAESTGPDAKGLHPRWRLRTAEKARKYMEPGQAVLKLGQHKYVVDDWFIIHDFQDQVHACVARCLKTGELGRLRKCLWCSKYFFASHFRQKFCSPNHQRRHDANAAPLRVEKSRMKARGRRLEQAQDAKDADSTKEFEKFLKNAGGNLAAQLSVGRLIKKIPGGWTTVTPWLEKYRVNKDAHEIWRNLPQEHKDHFAE